MYCNHRQPMPRSKCIPGWQSIWSLPTNIAQYCSMRFGLGYCAAFPTLNNKSCLTFRLARCGLVLVGEHRWGLDPLASALALTTTERIVRVQKVDHFTSHGSARRPYCLFDIWLGTFRLPCSGAYYPVIGIDCISRAER